MKNNKSHTNLHLKGHKQQQGMVLVISMILLLLITLLGVSAARMSSNDVQVAGNTIFSGLVYQGAESALGKVASDDDLFSVRLAANAPDVVHVVDAAFYFPSETVTGGAKLKQEATIKLESKEVQNLPFTFPNSSLFTYKIFRTKATSSLRSTSARAIHTEGRALANMLP
jgi:hypothetical protein